MKKIWFPTVNLHEELFIRRNIRQALFVILNVLARNTKYRIQVTKSVKSRQIKLNFERFLFDAMTETVRKGEQVDIEQIRCNIPLWVDERGSPEFVAQCLANFALLLTYRPTPQQVDRAIKIITLPVPHRGNKTKSNLSNRKKSKQVEKKGG